MIDLRLALGHVPHAHPTPHRPTRTPPPNRSSGQQPGAPAKRRVDVDRGPRRAPLPTDPGWEWVHIQANCGVWLTARGRGHGDTRPPTHRTRHGNTCPGPHKEYTVGYTGTRYPRNATWRLDYNGVIAFALQVRIGLHARHISLVESNRVHVVSVFHSPTHTRVVCAAQSDGYPSLVPLVCTRGAL